MKEYKKKIRQASNAYVKYLDCIHELETLANDIIKDSKYFIKSPQIAVVPLVLMSALYVFVPSLISQTSLMLLPSGALALQAACLCWPRRWVQGWKPWTKPAGMAWR